VKKGLVGVLRALGVLLAIWGVLAAVALVAGVVPPGTTGEDDVAESEPVADASDEQRDGDTAAGELPDAGTDAGAERAAATTGDAVTVQRWTVCDGAVRRPTLTALQVVGSPVPELAVGCDGVIHLLAVTGPEPARVATFDAVLSDDASASMRSGPPAAGDVDGDSLPDLVLPFWQVSGDGAARGGKLFLVRREATGAFEQPRLLGPIAAVDVALAQLADEAGLDIVAMNRGSATARRPSEVWGYTGGPAPVRSAVLRTGLEGTAVAIADLDRDDHGDVVALTSGEPRVDVFFGDGTGLFPRSSTLAITGATEALAVDLDGREGTDVLVRGEGLHLLGAGPVEALEPSPIDVPQGLGQLAATDVDGDGALDLVGLVEGEIVVLTQEEDLRFVAGEGRRPAPVVLQRLTLVDVNGDGALEGAALGRAGTEQTPWELVILPSVGDGSPLVGTHETRPLPDAPLVLHVPLG